MGRGTLGTGMMAPLQMANNFVGPYYAGPSGAAMGALMASQAIGEGFRDWGASKGRQQDDARVQEERDRVRMDELNQRQAVAQAINPMQAAQSSGMGNRDMSRRMALPDANTQMGIYKLQESRDQQAQEQKTKNLSRVATFWAINGGETADPGGKQFMQKFGYSPYEYADPNVISRMQDKQSDRDLRLQMAEGQQENARLIASMGQGGGGSTAKAPSGYRTVIDENGEQRFEFVPGGPADPSNKKDDLRSIPTAAVASLTGNFGTLSRIDESLTEIEKAPYATNFLKGAINDVAPNMINRFDPDGANARAALGDLGSTIIHDRSGAAVTASEYPRLRPFIPTAYDDAATVKMKLKRFREIVAEETRLYADNFSPEMGYKRPESWNKYIDGQSPQQEQKSAPQAQTATPELPAGFKVLP